MDIAKTIKEGRIKKGITQTELGKKIGKSLRMVQKYENGEVIPSIEVLNKIGVVLNLFIFDFSDSEYKSENDLYIKNKEYMQKIEYMYEAMENLTGYFASMDNIWTKMQNIGIDNYRNVLPERDLDLILKSLHICLNLEQYFDAENTETKDALEVTLKQELEQF